jgi:predicted ATPase
MVETVSTLSTARRLEVRVGISSGVVVAGDLIGEGSAAEFALVGEAPNLAARLQALAGANQILISAATQRLLGRIFETADLGKHDVRGFDQPVHVWRIVGRGTAATRFEALQAAHLTPLFGREQELAFLRDKYSKAEHDQGQVILICGEPGIGKSRLVMELTQGLTQPCVLMSFQCSSYHTSSAWYPIIRYLERSAGITHDTPAEQKFQKLRAVVHDFLDDAELALLASLLSISSGTAAHLDLTPQQQKNRTFAALLKLFQAQTRRSPAILVFEDVHWIDPTSFELLERLRDQVQSWRMCVIVLFRPELSLPWMEAPQVVALTINRLDRDQVAAMAKLLSANAELPSAITDQIVNKSDGVPLFVEEMTKAVLDYQRSSEAQLLSDFRSRITVPDTLHESLMARLDQVAPMKAVAQIAAVIGREFSFDLVQAVAHLTKEEVRIALDRLLAAGLLFRSGRPSDQIYAFKHALVQDEAYASLLREERRELHLRAAEVLCGDLIDIGNASPEVVAYHYTRAGQLEAAIDYWIKAGRRASERFVFAEASTHFQMALKLLADLPPGSRLEGSELQLQYALGNALTAVKGFSAPESGAAFKRALELCQKSPGSPETNMVIHGIIGFQATRGEFEETRKLGEELIARAGPDGDVMQRLVGHRALGMSQFLIGQLKDARRQLETTLELFDAHGGPSALASPQDARATAQAFLALTSILLGDIKGGFAQANSSVARAEQLRHPHSIAYVLTFLAGAHVLCREPERAQAILDRSIGLSIEYGFPLWAGGGQMLRGWARAKLGEIEQGLTDLRLSVEALAATGALIWVQFARYLLAQTLADIKERGAASKLVDETLSAIPRNSGRWYEAELYRLKGSLLVGDAPVSAIESWYEKAIATAASQGARLWELRATNALAMLWCSCGRTQDGIRRLTPLCNSFVCETAVPDLREAKELLSG